MVCQVKEPHPFLKMQSPSVCVPLVVFTKNWAMERFITLLTQEANKMHTSALSHWGGDI